MNNIEPKPVKERSNLDLLELVCQLHGRALDFPSKEMHDAYIEARQEMEKRLQEIDLPENKSDGWIPVSKRLPEVPKEEDVIEVLVVFERNGKLESSFCYYNQEHGFHYLFGNFLTQPLKITQWGVPFWQPLPQPPQGEKGEK